MKERVTRRQVILAAAATTCASAIATNVAPSHAVDMTQPSLNLPKAFRNEQGKWIVPLRVIAADDFNPVEGVHVDISAFAIPGGRDALTDSDGMTFLHQGTMHEATYCLLLTPKDGSRFATTTETLTIQADGTYYPSLVRLAFHETARTEIKVYAIERANVKT